MASRPDDISRPRRSTFAFDVQNPVERPLDGGPSYRGGQIVGGRAIGGDASPAGANPVNFGGQVSAFVDDLLKPYAERKARENFIKGMTDQMYAEAGQEIRAGDGFLTKIFGPSAYEEGAIFYDARQRVAQAQAEWQADEDELKKLPPNEVAKAWAQKLEQTLTGDPFTDDAIKTSMLEASGPMLQSVAKARYAWGQQQTVSRQQMAWKDGASAYQLQAQSFANTADPSEDEIAGYEAATNNFLAGMQMPAGQDEESYRKSISSAFRRMIQDGNGHAASALMRRGILDVLTPEERIRAEDQYLRYGKIATGNAAAEFVDDINVLQGQLAFGEIDGTRAVAELRALNERIKRATGFDVDYFDTDDQEAALKGVWSAAKAAADRLESRQWQLEDEAARQNFELQRDQQRAQIDAAAAEAAFRSNSPGSAMVAGAVKNDAMQARLYAAYQDNDFAGLSRSYKDGIRSSAVKEAISGTINSSIYSGYTPEFDGLAQKFEGMMSVNPALAKEYFGDSGYPQMLNYRKLLSGGATRPVAFALAFGDDIQYSPDNRLIGAARKDVVEWVQENAQPGILSRIFAGEEKLNQSGQQELANLISREVATDSKFAGASLSPETLRKTALERARTNGQFEKYGPLAWTNRPNTQPLYRLMQMQQSEANAVVKAAVDFKLKQAGFAKGASGDEYVIERGRYNGVEQLIVVPIEDGVMNSAKTAVVDLPYLQRVGESYRRRKVSAGAKTPQQRQAPAQRRTGLPAGYTNDPRKGPVQYQRR